MAARSPRRARQQHARAWLARGSTAGLLIVAGAVAGCGGVAASTSSPTKRGLEVTSPALTPKQTLPALYTCAGRNVSPPIKWGAIPPNTAELALFLLNLGHTQSAGAGGALEAKLTVGWSVHGIQPTLHELAAGKLPARATTGRARYSVCPPKKGTGEYMFRLYALPKRLSAGHNLTDLELFRKVNRTRSAVGYFISSYTRG
jgi:phosphatidylethanolamine-binding protein (PEBP) family uncharacterized protein